MKAHIVGGGFGGLAAAGYLILNAKVPGQDITIYEAEERMGGGFFLGGSAQSGYNLPGSVFDSEFRCAFALLDAVPCAWNPPTSIKKEFFTFNESHPFDSRGHLIGLAVADGDAPLVIADNDEGVEAETATSLDHRGTAADLYHTVFQSVLRP